MTYQIIVMKSLVFINAHKGSNILIYKNVLSNQGITH